MEKYNINELLEKKKELESQIQEELNIDSNTLVYQKEKLKDLQNNIDRDIEVRPKKSLNEYSQKHNGLVSELSKIKTAISKFNAEFVSENLYKREASRNKIEYLKRIKSNLKKDKQEGRRVTRTNSDGVALEIVDFEIRPMFEYEEVEKLINQTSAEERKLNTEIQKINLNAEIEL